MAANHQSNPAAVPLDKASSSILKTAWNTAYENSAQNDAALAKLNKKVKAYRDGVNLCQIGSKSAKFCLFSRRLDIKSFGIRDRNNQTRVAINIMHDNINAMVNMIAELTGIDRDGAKKRVEGFLEDRELELEQGEMTFAILQSIHKESMEILSEIKCRAQNERIVKQKKNWKTWLYEKYLNRNRMR
ncbi:hypothetical protein BS50DRAFT_589529 [Corynespora cassiicola Philippines]|uniref:Uncharacterized protein n=1 Tax=Corynespora cassiicola Philippines TaxID=1448308 RepID=A0A2T2NI20_CORCC|nr:hypothetical protein BS50DRAFT_589529 [Corynespora cassiicola Philippines]